jgi:hypothetical protein
MPRPNNSLPAADADARPPASNASPGQQVEQSSLADDPMTRLWQNADDRETGAEAVEAMRARRRNLGARAPEGRRFRR